MSKPHESYLRLALPDGVWQGNIIRLLKDAGFAVNHQLDRNSSVFQIANFNVKFLNARNIVNVIQSGSRDLGFTSKSWVQNHPTASLIELMDTELNAASMVVAGRRATGVTEAASLGLPSVNVASEYEHVVAKWINEKHLRASFVYSHGLPQSGHPEDSDFIICPIETDDDLPDEFCRLETLFASTTCLYSNPDSYRDPLKKAAIDDFVLLLKSAVLGRKQCLVIFNVCSPETVLDQLLSASGYLGSPRIQRLYSKSDSDRHDQDSSVTRQLDSGEPIGYAVTIRVTRANVPSVVVNLKNGGALDIVVSEIEQLIE